MHTSDSYISRCTTMQTPSPLGRRRKLMPGGNQHNNFLTCIAPLVAVPGAPLRCCLEPR